MSKLPIVPLGEEVKRDSNVCVGLTGLSGTGKDTVGKMVSDLASAHGVQIRCYNLSDEVREELIRRGQGGAHVSRSTLIAVGNELRATYGGGILATRIIANDRIPSAHNAKPRLVIVAGIRNPDEVKVFRAEWGNQGTFVLVAVESSLEVRAARLASRGQYQEDASPSSPVEKADQAIGINACVQMSDWHIRNDGNLEQLLFEVQKLFSHEIAPALRIGHFKTPVAH